jgi:uncharacterized membrane protein HdeD (DUF308 family)
MAKQTQPKIILEEELKINFPTKEKSQILLKKLFHNRWLLLVKGLFMVIFGLIAFIFPELTLLVLLWYLAVMIIII